MKNGILGLFKYGLGLGLLAYVVRSNWEPASPDGYGLKNIFDNPVRWYYLLIAFVLSIFSLLLTIVRWHSLVVALGIPFRLYTAVRLGLVGFTFNTILPSSVGGDLIKAIAIYRNHPERRSAALSTILVDRIIGLWAMFVMVAGMGAYLWLMDNPIVSENERMKKLLKIPFVTVLATTTAWLMLGFLRESFARKVEKFFRSVPRLGKPLGEIWNAVWLYRSRPMSFVLAACMCFVSNLGWVLAYHCAARAFAVSPNPSDLGTFQEHLLITPTGMALQAFVPTPGGVGGGEAFFGMLYELIGKPSAIGVLMCFTMRLLSYLVGITGYIIYLRLKNDGSIKHIPTSPSDPAVQIDTPDGKL